MSMTVDALLAKMIEGNQNFERYKSNICHMVKEKGDLKFIIETLELNQVRKLYEMQWYPESLYLLAMLDYLCHVNDLPICKEYRVIRSTKLKKTIYPASVMTLSATLINDLPKEESIRAAIPEFLCFNIVESEILNVY